MILAKKKYIDEGCDYLISIGGGSAIDTAKAVKAFLPFEDNGECLLGREHVYVNVKHVAVPTTAGTGSESTQFSVIYYGGEKQSLDNPSLLPDLAVLDPSYLKTLPGGQKSATVLDALCQATESIWAVRANEISIAYAKEAIRLIVANVEGYMRGESDTFAPIMLGANLAGRAINITTTTAAHAMSYKLTTFFGIPHGAAVAMSMIPVFEYYNTHSDNATVRSHIAEAYGVLTAEDALASFMDICNVCRLKRDVDCSADELLELVRGVNPERLKNYPIKVTSEEIEKMYKTIVNVK